MNSPTVTVRVAPLLLASVEAAIKAHNSHPLVEPHTMSSWINAAMAAKLDHIKRGRQKRKQSPKSSKRPASTAN